ncbi:MAG: endolytic transglycosylase MltG [Alphaproteobacteria bacterium]|nr:endolytic transglycosylase MltG [Alphaproteobacteria bacterium]
MKILKRLLLLTFTGIILGGVFLYHIYNQINTPYPINSPKEITISKGATLNQIAHTLKQNSLIKNTYLFIIYARISKISSDLKAGEYLFDSPKSIPEIAYILKEGKVIKRSITIPEGKALVEILEIINKHPHLKGEITVSIKEGDILPETYVFASGTTRNEIIKQATLAMEKTLNNAYKNLSSDSPIKTKQELLILASIIEKETGLKNERSLVASVFINRLKIGMRLQTDPTVIYAVTNGKMNLERALLKKDLTYDSPYNTYVYNGLPPTPICSPGTDAINAATNPSDTKYLYFVADGITGGHRFATNLQEHNKNVALYRKARK